MQLILAIVEGVPSDRAVLQSARLAAQIDIAHVEVLCSLPDPRDMIPIVGEGLSGDVVERLMAEATAEIDRMRGVARSAYDEFAASTRFETTDSPGGSSGSTTSWREATGRALDVVPAEGRLADLVIIGRAETKRHDRGAIEATIFGSGRPILMVPPDPVTTLGSRIAVFWNGSIEASRAVSAALPYLAKADGVQVMAVDESLDPLSPPSDLVRYLAWHGIKAELRTIEPDHRQAGEALIEEAENDGADMVVMGAYTHSRLRQMILGGVTSHTLEHAPLPVLMCH